MRGSNKRDVKSVTGGRREKGRQECGKERLEKRAQEVKELMEVGKRKKK